MKYVDVAVEFGEVPNEISLCINISGCQIRCPECHSKYLWEDVGTELTPEVLNFLVEKNKGISCVCLMGGQEKDILTLLSSSNLPQNLKVAWYSGSDVIPEDELLRFLDYLKIGPYNSKFGPINVPTTNQKFYRVVKDPKLTVVDCTNSFWESKET